MTGSGKIVANEKVHTRQQAEPQSFREERDQKKMDKKIWKYKPAAAEADAEATSATKSAAAAKAATGSEATTEVRQLERETAAANSKKLDWIQGMLKATESIDGTTAEGWQQQAASASTTERAAAFQTLQSFQIDALNCICAPRTRIADILGGLKISSSNGNNNNDSGGSKSYDNGRYIYRLSRKDDHRTWSWSSNGNGSNGSGGNRSNDNGRHIYRLSRRDNHRT